MYLRPAVKKSSCEEETRGKETSTTGEKQSPREEREVERLEEITKQDSDSQTNNSKYGPDGSLLVNAPDEKQSAKEVRRADRQERITKRVPSELDDGALVLNSTKVTSDLHNLDSEEEKQEVTEFTNSDNRDASMGRDWRARRPRQSDSEEEEEEIEDPTPGAFAFSNEQGILVRRIKGHVTTSMVEESQTSSLSLMENEVPTSPSVHS